MNLYCESHFKIGLIGSLYFLGFVLSGGILMLADWYGRRIISIIGTIASTIFIFMLYFATSINQIYVLIFLTGITIFRSYSFYML